jgi:hypothetical protein
MNIIKLYECLNFEEKDKLRELLIGSSDLGKTEISTLLDKVKGEITPRLHDVLTIVSNGLNRYKCRYVEDLDFDKLSRFRGVGETSILKLKYFINKSKNEV